MKPKGGSEAMRYTQLGGLSVSVIGLGCNTFGRNIDADVATELVEEALADGITFFDTADAYGNGTSEGILGSALGGRRDDVVIATKFGLPIDGVPGSGGGRPEYVFEAAERSLRELQRDWIDLYQMHRPDPETPIERTLEAVKELIDRGTVRAFGCSNFTPDQLGAAVRAADDLGFPVVSTQTEYSVVNREPEETGLSDVCVAQSIALLPYRPLAKGLLSGRMRRGDEPINQLARDRYQRFLTEENFDLVERIREFAAERGKTPAEVSIHWLLHRPAVGSVFPGATRREQVRSNASAGAWNPTAEDLAFLDAVVG